jgi:hypothetical protein
MLLNRQSDQYQRVGNVLRDYHRRVPKLPKIPRGDDLQVLTRAVAARQTILEGMADRLEQLLAHGQAH